MSAKGAPIAPKRVHSPRDGESFGPANESPGSADESPRPSDESPGPADHCLGQLMNRPVRPMSHPVERMNRLVQPTKELAQRMNRLLGRSIASFDRLIPCSSG